MRTPKAPRIDQRRTKDFSVELQARARSWIPSWAFADVEGDFGRALLEIAARFNSEVAERLDGAGEKMRRGFLDWLAVRREAARPARVPVVFKLADAAREAVLASAPVRLQADVDGTAVVFETESDVFVVPGQLDLVVGVDAGEDAFYLPAPGLNDLKPIEQLPSQWQLKAFASSGAAKLQLDPPAGLVPKMVIEANGAQYLITKADSGIVTIEPPLDAELQQDTVVRKVTKFAPFDGITRNRQEHVLYIGDTELLNIESKALFNILGAGAGDSAFRWEYWGKTIDSDEPDWHRLVPPENKQLGEGLVLEKPAGAMEPRIIGGVNSRWLRAYKKKVDGNKPLLRTDQLSLRINYSSTPTDCAIANTGERSELSKSLVAMANTTPLVLEKPFSPLGREPRQLDAFYLGSEEAFSKKGAVVSLCFKMVEPTFTCLSYLRGRTEPLELVAGVSGDGRLHLLEFDPNSATVSLFRDRQPLQPPSPGASGISVDGPPVKLDAHPPFRTPIWTVGAFTFVAVTAKKAIWLWCENDGNSGWENTGEIPEEGADVGIIGLVYLYDRSSSRDGRSGQLLALSNSGSLYGRELSDPNGTWRPIETEEDDDPVKLTNIAPVLTPNSTADELLNASIFTGLVGVGKKDGIGTSYKLYHIAFETAQTGNCIRCLSNISPNVTPTASRIGKRLVAVALDEDNENLLAFLSEAPNSAQPIPVEGDLEGSIIIRDSIDVNIRSGQLTFGFALQADQGKTMFAAWTPFKVTRVGGTFQIERDPIIFKTKIPDHVEPGGAPTLLPQHIIVPTVSGPLAVTKLDLADRKTFKPSTGLRTALVAPRSEDKLELTDQLFIRKATETEYKELKFKAAVDHEGEALNEIEGETSVKDDFLVFKTSKPAPLTGKVNTNHLDKIRIDDDDETTTKGSLLVIDTKKSVKHYTVTALAPGSKTATISPDLDVDTTLPNVDVSYWLPESTDATLLPLLVLSVADGGDWNASVLERTRLRFLKAEPELQFATAFRESNGRPELLVLREAWQTIPAVVEFVVDESVGEWLIRLGKTFANPELSWEYWNGKGWWGLKLIGEDKTENLKTSGLLEFEVPPDIALSDWAGKTNFWIRARLIGGDYGKEKITVKITPLDKGASEQTIDRSTVGIRPPSVERLDVSYKVVDPNVPTYVLVQDSGSILDQSDANRTSGAIVEAFVPLSLMLARLSGEASTTTEASDEECPPDCECPGQKSAESKSQPEPTTTPADSSSTKDVPTSGRLIFLGLNTTVSDGPVNVLLLVDKESDNGAFAPLTITALAERYFNPIVAADATRALGESGIVSISFAVPPTLNGLFGSTRTWLRLNPAAAVGEWTPSLRGAYLNAVYATAKETLTREKVGSSDGSPNLTLSLARPPVLRDTLELRVLEPLGEEEREALLKSDPTLVVSNVEGLPGDWVLWKQVTDPDDEAASARVYALDEATGVIRFGDGTHGRIPPIGRDAIVAFQYARTEGGAPGSTTVPANSIAARMPLNLVSPVETVESVIAADQAAGGAPAETDERVLRFGFARLRHRERAVTSKDIEDLTLQSSPAIAQAKALTGRGFVRLIVVMKGKQTGPNAAQVRELRRLLLASSPISMSAPRALRIEGPRIRRLRIELVLGIRSLDDAGRVSKWVKEQLKTFFDSAVGGIEKDGWELGSRPSEEDIAFVLINAPCLDGISEVNLFENVGNGVDRRFPATVGPTDLVVLDDDPVRIRFETAEVTV